jgi:hypothetical protein
MTAAVHAIAGRRERLLRVMGVTPWRLRSRPSPDDEAPMPAFVVPADGATCVVIVPAGCTGRELDLVGRALHGFGPAFARAARLEVTDGAIGPVPVAGIYLAFGEAQARALGRELPGTVLSAAHIVLVDEPSRVLAEASAKRRLWNALRTLRRAMHAPAS